MSDNVIYALEIMGKGMTSIFAVVLLLTLIVYVLSKVTNLSFGKKKKDAQ